MQRPTPQQLEKGDTETSANSKQQSKAEQARGQTPTGSQRTRQTPEQKGKSVKLPPSANRARGQDPGSTDGFGDLVPPSGGGTTESVGIGVGADAEIQKSVEEKRKEKSRARIRQMLPGGGWSGIRMMSPKQMLTIIIVVFSMLSFIKLLFLTTSSSSAFSSAHRSAWTDGGGNGTGRGALAAKELALLRSLVAARAPCRLLVFGLSPQLLALAALNSGAGAATAFVTDSAEHAGAARHALRGEAAAAAVAVHRARYRDAAREAWPLLRRARGSPACRRTTGTVRKSGCPLALTAALPREVLDTRWDVVVVDGPSGAAPEEPGRMGTIYTAAALARAAAAADGGAAVDVAVHDVDRTVERWYAWEYLCEDNLVAAKGRLWHFRIAGGGPADAFCTIGPAQIL